MKVIHIPVLHIAFNFDHGYLFNINFAIVPKVLRTLPESLFWHKKGALSLQLKQRKLQTVWSPKSPKRWIHCLCLCFLDDLNWFLRLPDNLIFDLDSNNLDIYKFLLSKTSALDIQRWIVNIYRIGVRLSRLCSWTQGNILLWLARLRCKILQFRLKRNSAYTDIPSFVHLDNLMLDYCNNSVCKMHVSNSLYLKCWDKSLLCKPTVAILQHNDNSRKIKPTERIRPA